jgi:hypothetical protein
MNHLAQVQHQFGGFFEGLGPLGLEGQDPGTAAPLFNVFISSVVGLMTIIAVIWFIILFITGAIGIMNAGGDKAAMEAARKRLTNAVIGLIVVVAAIFIIRLIGYLLGVKFILNPASYIESLSF